MKQRQRKIINIIFLWILLVCFSILSPCSAVGEERIVGYDSRGKRDPMVSLLKGEKKADYYGFQGVEDIEDIRIEGVVVDPQKGSYVIANGVVLAQNEEEGNVRVLEIQENGVLFQIGTKKQFKPFEEKEIQEKPLK